jgi:hypothetical protein
MAKTTSPRSNKVDPIRPFYAAVGGVDVAVAAARNGISEAQSRLSKVDLAPKAIPGQLESAFTEYVAETVEDLNKQYADLAARGRSLVNRIRRQQATQDLTASAKSTTTRAKAATTRTKNSARSTADTAGSAARSTVESASTAARTTADSATKTAKTAKSSAKGTGTAARKTASAAKKATADAAAKTGN